MADTRCFTQDHLLPKDVQKLWINPFSSSMSEGGCIGHDVFFPLIVNVHSDTSFPGTKEVLDRVKILRHLSIEIQSHPGEILTQNLKEIHDRLMLAKDTQQLTSIEVLLWGFKDNLGDESLSLWQKESMYDLWCHLASYNNPIRKKMDEVIPELNTLRKGFYVIKAERSYRHILHKHSSNEDVSDLMKPFEKLDKIMPQDVYRAMKALSEDGNKLQKGDKIDLYGVLISAYTYNKVVFTSVNHELETYSYLPLNLVMIWNWLYPGLETQDIFGNSRSYDSLLFQGSESFHLFSSFDETRHELY